MKNRAFRIIVITALISCAATVILLRWDMIPAASNLTDSTPVVAAAPESSAKMSSDEEINVRVYNDASPGVVNITSIVALTLYRDRQEIKRSVLLKERPGRGSR